MKKAETNRQLGMKWFVFYTKFRPWLACILSLTVITDFLQYTKVYLNYWWMFLYFLASIVQPILAIIVFVKSKGNYEEFVRFVNGVLIYETVNMAYSMGVQAYIKYFDIGTALVSSLITSVAGYFLWYRLNIKYFRKRIPREESEFVSCDSNATLESSQETDSDKIFETNGQCDMSDDIETEAEGEKIAADDINDDTDIKSE